MPILDKNRVYDGFDSLIGGMDSGRNPGLIDVAQCARADNIAFRGGVPKTRPGFDDVSLSFETIGLHYADSGVWDGYQSPPSSAAFFGAMFQGAVYYSPGAGKPECILAMIGGRLFKLTPRVGMTDGIVTDMEVNEIKLDKTNSRTLPRAYMVQADRFCVIQDGQSKPIVYDGVNAWRSDDIPVGTIMSYGMGRLVIVVNQFREIVFGDLYGSNRLDSADPGRSVLRFTETGFLNEGGTASIAFSLGKLSGLHFVPQQDTSVGDGELLAFSERGMTTFQLALPREQWKESNFQRVILYNVGARGWRSIVSIGEDVWFRSDDGWRSYRQARAEAGGWNHLPMSTEVGTWVNNDTPQWLDYGSAITFDNRLICTCTPQPNERRVFHNGLLSLDFNVLSTFGQSTRPAWDGHWSRIRCQQLVAGSFDGVPRAFSFGLLPTGDVSPGQNAFVIKEITRDGIDDGGEQIAWQLIPKSMDFQSPYNEKELWGADLWIDDVRTPDMSISLQYRPDQHPNWTDWQTLPGISPVGTAQAITPGGVPTLKHNFFPRRTIEKPQNDVDSSDFTGRNMRRGYEFQARITGVGHCKIRKMRLHAKNLTEDDKNTE